jgi:uncharacterized protein YjdB
MHVPGLLVSIVLHDSSHHWTSSNPSVATIDDQGLATGMGAGTTEITATLAGKSSAPVVLTLCDFRHL